MIPKQWKVRTVRYCYQVLLLATGAAIAFFSTWLNRSIDYERETIAVAGYIEGCVNEDVRSYEKLLAALKQYPVDDPGGAMSATSFRWQHESYALEAAAPKVGLLDLEIIELFAKYRNMTEQAKAFRQTLYESLEANGGNLKGSKPWLLAYADSLEVTLRAAHELHAAIQHSYARKGQRRDERTTSVEEDRRHGDAWP